MKPLTVPASTVTTALAGAVTTLIVWAAQTWGHVTMPSEVVGAITTLASVIACHFTSDAPPN